VATVTRLADDWLPKPKSFTLGRTSASPSNTRGGSRMRAFRTYGCVRGAHGNGRPYRSQLLLVSEVRRRAERGSHRELGPRPALRVRPRPNAETRSSRVSRVASNQTPRSAKQQSARNWRMMIPARGLALPRVSKATPAAVNHNWPAGHTRRSTNARVGATKQRRSPLMPGRSGTTSLPHAPAHPAAAVRALGRFCSKSSRRGTTSGL
jgi:hypothetical protein